MSTTPDGFFGKVSYLGIGDEYDKRSAPKKKDEKDDAKPFIVTASKSGNGPDALFDKKIKSLAQGSPFIDNGRIGVPPKGKDEVKPAPFIVTKGTKMSVIPGILGAYPKHEPDYDVVRRGEKLNGKKEKSEDEKRAAHTFVTNPGKKGGAGFIGTAIGGKEFKYIASPYADPPRTSGRNIGLPNAPPFKSAVGRTGGFDVDPHTGSDKIYSLSRPLPARKESKKVPPAEKPPAPWKPANGHRSGHIPLSGKYPEYLSDPKDVRDAKKMRAEHEDKSANQWKPTSGPKSRLTRSIAFNASLVR